MINYYIYSLLPAALITLAYTLSNALLLKGWKSLKCLNDGIHADIPGVSIIISIRNEEKQLPELLNALLLQDYPKDALEFLLVDDHSEDGSREILEKWRKDNPGLKINILVPLNGRGKKKALETAVDTASMEYLLFTDADCFMGADWVSSMVNYASNRGVVLVLGPVLVKPSNSVLGKLQTIETTALQSVTAGSAGLERAVMGNGANLMCRREIYCGAKHNVNTDNHASGDDVFLVHAVKRMFGGQSITYACSESAVVTTYAESSLFLLWQQHIRWASKSSGYTDSDTLLLGAITLLCNTLLIYELIFSWFCPEAVFAAAGVLVVKFYSDYWLLSKMKRVKKQDLGPVYILIMAVVYPLFSVLIVLFSFRRVYYWKGRKMSRN